MQLNSQQLNSLPNQPGIYQYFSTKGALLYVGKAKNLRNRVKSYWRFTPSLHPNPNLSMRIVMMLQEAASLEYFVVESESDALVLENSLIKQLNPKYNILLRDDKTYPYIYIDNKEPFGRFEITRKVVAKPSISYYGPFTSGAKALYDALYSLFPLVQKSACLKGKKQCLYYEMKRCLAPCEGRVSQEEYAVILNKAKEALKKRSILTDMLGEKMMQLAAQERFEEAAKVRDQIEAIKQLSIQSQIDIAKEIDADVFGIVNGEHRGVVVKLFLRDGRINSSDYHYFRHTHLFDSNSLYKQALLDFYHKELPFMGQEILVAHPFEELDEVKAILKERFGRNITISAPQIGPKAKLTALCLKNGNELLSRSVQKQEDQLEAIAHLFALEKIPYRVEVFDNSHTMGEAPVGGMVVYDDGKWDKSSYRSFNLQSQNEYDQMREMLQARIEHFSKLPPPDLWLLDGGKANINLAKTLLRECNVGIDVMGIAKEKLDSKAHRAKGAARDIIYVDDEIFELLPTDKRLVWLQMLRDEAHRYAISTHRKKRQKGSMELELEKIKGVGRATVGKLVAYFGKFDAIGKASLEELSEVVNKKAAKAIYDFYHNS